MAMDQHSLVSHILQNMVDIHLCTWIVHILHTHAVTEVHSRFIPSSYHPTGQVRSTHSITLERFTNKLELVHMTQLVGPCEQINTQTRMK